MNQEEDKPILRSADGGASEGKQNFGSWRDELEAGSPAEQDLAPPSRGEVWPRQTDRQQAAGNLAKRDLASPDKKRPVDGFVSKEGFVVDDGKQETGSREQKTTTPPPTPPKTPPPPKPQPTPPSKPGCSKWVKGLILAIVIILILFILWLFFLYKSTLDVAVSAPGAKIMLDNKSRNS